MAIKENTRDSIKFHCIEDNDSFKNVSFVNYFRQTMVSLIGFIHYISGAMVGIFGIHIVIQLRREKLLDISPADATWITSIFLLPTGPMCILTGLVMQKIPKRYLLIGAFVLELIGWLLQYFLASSSVFAILIGRFVIGAVLAVVSTVMPLYLAEVTHPKSRGFCISAVFMGITIGFLMGNIIGNTFTWKTYIHVCISFTLISLATICCLKETYVWHLNKKDMNNATESFYWYRGRTEESNTEISKYIVDHSNMKDDKPDPSSFRDFWNNVKLLAFPLVMTVTLIATLHLSGYKVIILYSIQILGLILSSVDAYLLIIILDVFRIVATMVGCVLIKKYRVRVLLLVSGSGSALALGVFCIFRHFSYIENVLPIFSLVALAMFIVFSSIGLASLPMVVCGEIFPLKVKNIGCGISLFAYYGIYFLCIKFAPLLETYFGVIGEFMFFCGCTTFGTIIIYFFMPETKNKTLREIETSIKL